MRGAQKPLRRRSSRFKERKKQPYWVARYPGIRRWRKFARLPLTSKLGLVATRSRSRKNNALRCFFTLSRRFTTRSARQNRTGFCAERKNPIRINEWQIQNKKRTLLGARYPGIRQGAKIPSPCVWCASTPTFGQGNRTGFCAKRKNPIRINEWQIQNKNAPYWVRFCFGAATRIRTGDLILTKDVLYQLSHSSVLYASVTDV